MTNSIINQSDTNVKIKLTGTADDLAKAKSIALTKLAPQVKVPGFRPGRAPAEVIEKHLDPNTVAKETLDNVLNMLYSGALEDLKLRPVSQPQVNLTKFVPYTDIEFEATIEIVGNIKLGKYKDLKIAKEKPEATAKDVTDVIDRLQQQMAEYKEVTRVSKNGDRVWIDFEGFDTKGEPVAGAKGQDYPLVLGSNTFIPGFEKNLVAVKPDQEIDFTLTFPKDYGVKALQSKRVTFKVTVKKVEEVTLPKVDDELAKKVGNFKTVDDLKKDIKKQILEERGQQAERAYQDLLIKTIAESSQVALPESLLQEQAEMLDREFKQNLTYRGQTFQEYLESTGLSEDEYKEKELRPLAERRLKEGLVLSEIAEQEDITVTPEELEIRIQILKGQYKEDPKMQAELDKQSSRHDIAARLLTEKTITKLVSLNK
ncbi:MAG: trigger factor [Patescibacteria group bacterium]|jgi:trigger factor|nr:trigger factor [Patescibacteria group bacterium]